MSPKDDFTAPVPPDNQPRRTRRPPPDDPAAAQDMPLRTGPTPGNAVAATGDPLASKLASKHASGPRHEDGDEHVPPSPTLSVEDIVRLRRREKKIDPFEDWAGDGTRKLTWIQDAIGIVADITGRKRQVVVRDALLGITPLPEEILDAAYWDHYGERRPRDIPR